MLPVSECYAAGLLVYAAGIAAGLACHAAGKTAKAIVNFLVSLSLLGALLEAGASLAALLQESTPAWSLPSGVP